MTGPQISDAMEEQTRRFECEIITMTYVSIDLGLSLK